MVKYFGKWWSVLLDTGDTGNFFLAIWSLGALVLPFVVVFGVIVAVATWIEYK